MKGFRMLGQWIAQVFRGRNARLIGVVVVMSLLFSSTVTPQLQQSGGGGSNASVGATGAAAPSSATLAGGNATTAAPTYTTATMNALSLNTSGGLRVDGSGVTQPVSGTVTANLGAGTAAVGTVRPNPLTSCGNTIFDSAITTVPTTEAAATATSTCVQVIYCNNLTATAQTFSIKDNAATPIVLVNAFSLPGNSNILISFGGIKFNLGVRWVATNAASVNCQIYGVQ